MFEVRVESLYQAHGEITRAFACMTTALEAIGATRRRLPGNTGMEVPYEELSTLMARLETQSLTIGQTARALEHIAEAYRRAENRAMERADSPPRPRKAHTWITNDLSGLRQTLGDTQFV